MDDVATADNEGPVLPQDAAEASPLDPESHFGPIEGVAAKGGGCLHLEESDMISTLMAMVRETKMVGSTINGYNDLVEKGINKIVREIFSVKRSMKNELTKDGLNNGIDHFTLEAEFNDASIGMPVKAEYSGKTVKFYPAQARNSGVSYSGPFRLSANVSITAHYEDGSSEKKSAYIPTFEMSQFPIMVGSNLCHTHNLTKDALKQIREDPKDPGGYFIIKGEWAVENLENICFNTGHIHKNLDKEFVRCEFISQPGGAFENSSQIVVRYLKEHLITVEINTVKFQRLQIPFYLIFRMFGVSSDIDILKMIAGDIENPTGVDIDIVEIVDRALHLSSPRFEGLKNELNRQVIREELAVLLSRHVTNRNSYKDDEDAIRYLTNHLQGIMDTTFLPHIGQDKSSRITKMRYFSMIIRDMMLVHLGAMSPADRDSLTVKRMHGPGASLAKSFKSYFNYTYIQHLIAAIRAELRTTPFSRITEQRIQETARTMVGASAEMDRLMRQSLVSGNKFVVVGRRALRNRLASNAIERKNQLNLLSSLRRVSSHNADSATKGTERAELIRAVHRTLLGMVCPYHSADTGEKVGMEKQLACTTIIADYGDSLPLIARLKGDPSVTTLDKISNEQIIKERLAKVLVNGNWIGCCREPWTLVSRYRGMRRTGNGVTPTTTICWNEDSGRVEFWLDVGRLVRPMLIVDNNAEKYKDGKRKAFQARKNGEKDWEKHKIEFVQDIRLTPEHTAAIRRQEMTLTDMIEQGLAEYLSPEECDNCLFAEDVFHLRKQRNNALRQYTHCDIPQALCGIAALVSPYANHTQPARVTYETNQGRSTCGWYCGSWPFRADQLRFLQFYNQYPLVKTLAADLVTPNGMNTCVMYGTHNGDNQEDSAETKLGYVQRGGFSGVLFRRETVTLERGETFGTPDITNTRGMRAGASYAKLVDGFVTLGTRVVKGDVIVGRLAKEGASNSRGTRQGRGASASATYVDRSVVYNDDTPAVVDEVWKTQGQDDVPTVIIKLRFDEDLNVGDKISSRSGNKGITAVVMCESDMPYDENGVTPDIIINPHSVPSRMVIGQMLEAYISIVCAHKGTVVDGTPFRKLDLDSVSKQLKAMGLRESGHRTMFNPITGLPMEMAVFMGPTQYQRLLKFVDLNQYAAPPRGPTDALTGQPLDGKKAKGGLRFGEMEGWVLSAQGLSGLMKRKLHDDSDGRTAYYCRRCGLPAEFNESLNIYSCSECGEMADITSTASSQAALVFHRELSAMGIDVRMNFPARNFRN